MLELAGVTRRYGAVLALDALDLVVPTGTVFGFLGPNGAGKTTAMRAVFGISVPDAGEVRWRGHRVGPGDRARFGYLPEERGLYPGMRVGEQLAYLGMLHGMSAADAEAQTSAWLDRLGLGGRTTDRVETLSLGNQQRVQLAAALVHRPELLVLDEPFSGLDPVGVATMGRVLAEQAAAGVTVLFSSHQLDLVEQYCRRVAIIDHGRLLATGLVDDLTAADPPVLEVGLAGQDGSAWAEHLDGVTVAGTDRGRARLLLAPQVDSGEVLRAAMAVGTVEHFSFERRRLSEVFLDAVAGASAAPPAAGRSAPPGRPAGVGAATPANEPAAAPPPGFTGTPLGPAAAIRLVATREIRERWRTRSFKVTVLISVVLAAGAVILPRAVSGSKAALRIGVVGTLSPFVRAEVDDLPTIVGRPVVLVEEPDVSAASTLVRTRKLSAALTADRVIVRVEPLPTDTGTTARLVESLARLVGQDAAYRSAGLSNAQIAAVVGARPLPIVGLLANPSARNRQRTTTFAGILLLYAFITMFGAWVLYGVVEEKSSRVVEILLATLTATRLLAGKVLGIGLLAVAQGAAVAGAAFAAAAASGSDVLRGAAGATIVAMVGWFVLGYAFYACLHAAAGSLVGRQEEVQNVSFPLQLPLLIAYFTSVGSIFGTVSPLTVVLSYLPPTAPIAMPARLAAGSVPAWQVLVSVGLLLAGTAATVRLGAVVYNRAILRTGSRLSWRAALRASGV